MPATADGGAGARRSGKLGGGRGGNTDNGDDWVEGATNGGNSGEAKARLAGNDGGGATLVRRTRGRERWWREAATRPGRRSWWRLLA
jgi:hypothetical protein